MAIVQSNFIRRTDCCEPIAMAGAFVRFDDVQHTSRGWRNRHAIKTANGPLWLAIAVDAASPRPGDAKFTHSGRLIR
jgi:hypothetical protein